MQTPPMTQDGIESTNAISGVMNDSRIQPIAAAKILNNFAKDSNGAFTIKVGFVDGKVISAKEVEELASIPGREGLLTQLLYCLTNGPRGLAIALDAIANKNGEPAAEAEAPAEA